MSEPQHAGPAIVRRAIWVLVVPIVSALLPWLILDLAGSDPGGLGLLLVGAAPLVGGMAALSFSFVAPVRVLPLLPFTVAGAVFLFVLLAAQDMTSGNKLDFGPATVLGVILPVLAIAGGFISYAWLPAPAHDDEPENEPEGEPVS